MIRLPSRDLLLRALVVFLGVAVLALPLVALECQRLQHIHDAHLGKYAQLTRPADAIVGARNLGPAQTQTEQDELKEAYKREAGLYSGLLIVPFGLVQALMMLLLPGRARRRRVVRNTFAPDGPLVAVALFPSVLCLLIGIENPAPIVGAVTALLFLTLRHRLLAVPLARAGEPRAYARSKAILAPQGKTVWGVLIVAWLLYRVAAIEAVVLFSNVRAWENLRPAWLDVAWLTLPAVVGISFLVVAGDLLAGRALSPPDQLPPHRAGEVFA